MKDFEAWKKCKFCGMRLGREIRKCPNCGSSNIQLITHKYMELAKYNYVEEEKTVAGAQSGNKAKRKLRSMGIIVLVILVLCVGGSFAVGKWAEYMVRKDRTQNVPLTTNAWIDTVMRVTSHLEDDEWKQMMFPILDKLYEEGMDRELGYLCGRIDNGNKARPVSEWKHDYFAYYLRRFNSLEDILAEAEAGKVLPYDNYYELLGVYLYTMDYKNKNFTAEEKERLEPYFAKLDNCLTAIWDFTQEDWKVLIEKNMTAGAAIEARKNFIYHWAVEMELTGKAEWPEINVGDSKLSDEEWLEEMIPILDKLYAKKADKAILAVYNMAYDQERPLYEWEHYMYASALHQFDEVSRVLERERLGEIPPDYELGSILNYYFEYRDFETTYKFTDDEKQHLEKYVKNLRMDVYIRWPQMAEEEDELYTEFSWEDGYVSLAKVYSYVWIDRLLKKVESLEGDAWKVEMFPVLNQLFEQEKKYELYLIYKDYIKTQSKPFDDWEHYAYTQLLYEMQKLERIWSQADEGKELSSDEYTDILYGYLLSEDRFYSVRLTPREAYRLKPYFAKAEEYATALWDFTQGEWKVILEKARTVSVYRIEAEQLIHKWLQEKGEEE